MDEVGSGVIWHITVFVWLGFAGEGLAGITGAGASGTASKVVSRAGLQRMKAVVEELAQQPPAPAALSPSKYSRRRRCCSEHYFVE